MLNPLDEWLAVVDAQLQYDRETGYITWKVDRQKVKPGQIAGTIDKSTGYRQIRVGGKIAYAHRLAWYFAKGYWPVQVIDHLNGNKLDNRISNLRDCSVSDNLHNRVATKASTTGSKGVYWTPAKGKYKAAITVRGKQHHIGYFDSVEEASMAYASKAIQLGVAV